MNRKGTVTVLIIILCAIALLAHMSTTNLEFSRYNWAWSGTSEFFAELDAHGAHDLVSYDDLKGRNDTLLLIIAPQESFSYKEAAALLEFLEKGNTLFISDETGTSNGLLTDMGRSIRIQPGSICSVEKEFWDTWSVIAFARKPDPLLANVSALTLNRPSAVNDGEILVSTTLLSWEDTNMNKHLDSNESLETFGILARERVGNGTLYIFSDSSVFVNGMREVDLSGDNEIFIQNLLCLRRDILVEQSHSPTKGADPLLEAVIRVKNNDIVKITTLLVIISFIAVAFWRKWI